MLAHTLQTVLRASQDLESFIIFSEILAPAMPEASGSTGNCTNTDAGPLVLAFQAVGSMHPGCTTMSARRQARSMLPSVQGTRLGLLPHPPALNKCRSAGGYIIVGHVFLQLPVSVSSGNKQGYAWLALHEVAAKRGPRRGILQLTHSYRWGSENCNLHFLPPPLLSTGGYCRNSSASCS